MSRFADIVYSTKVGWETAVAGTLRFDVSKFDSADVFANAFPNFFTGALDDVTVDVVSGLITRGRDQLLGPVQAGTYDFTLSDPQNQPGYYNPANPASPLAALVPGFVPMRPVKVEATVLGTVYKRYYGFIRTAAYDPETRTCAVHAEDLLLWLSRVKPSFATLTGTTDQAVIGAILDAVQWTDPSMRRLSTFTDAIATYPDADGTQRATGLITNILAANRGVFFVSAGGVAVSEDRNARSRRTAAVTTFTKQQIAVSKNNNSNAINLDEILNEETITGADGIPATVINLPSQQEFGIGEIGDVTSNFIPDQGTARARASWEVAIESAMHAPYVARVDPDALEQVFMLDLQDRLAVADGDNAGDYHLERIVEPVALDAVRSGVELTLSKRGVSGGVFDFSKFDGVDVFTA